MTRITFVSTDTRTLGVEYLMGVCLKNGHEVEHVHYHSGSTVSKNGSTKETDAAVQAIMDTRPHVAAFSCMHYNYQDQLQVARIIKSRQPDIVILFGGIHPTSVPDKVIAEPAVDGIAIGESEISLVEFLARCANTPGADRLPAEPVAGIVFKRDGKLVGDFTEGALPQLDELPFPDSAPYFRLHKEETAYYSIMASRGCPYACSYCQNSLFHKMRGHRRIRRRSVGNVIEELQQAKDRLNCRYVLFLDDCFTASGSWLEEFCAAYREKIRLPFSCTTIPEYMSEDKARLLAASGCVFVQMGIQSLSDEIRLKVLERKSSNEKIAQAILAMRKAGIFVEVDHMLGIPGDTLEIQEQSLAFYSEYKPNCIVVFWLMYYPRTAIVDTALRLGILTEQDVEVIENGGGLTNTNYNRGGSLRDTKPFAGIAFMLNYLPFTPRWLVRLVLRRGLYRFLSTNNYQISTAIPRALLGILYKGNFMDRARVKAVFTNLLQRLRG